jgi:DNA-directed RNA polymerase specialized sigma24 family protein
VVLREALSNNDTPFAKLMRSGQDDLAEEISPAFPQVNRVDPHNYRMNRRLTRAERAQLTEQYGLGMSALELARQYGIHRHTVVKHLQRDGMVLRGGQLKMTQGLVQQALQFYAEGQSLATIGTRLGVDASTVHKALKRAGLKMRDTDGRAT